MSQKKKKTLFQKEIIKNLRSTVKKQNQEISAWEGRATAKTNRISSLTSEVDALKEEGDSQGACILGLKEEIARLKKVNESLIKQRDLDIKNLNTRLSMRDKTFGNLSENIRALNSDLKEAKSEYQYYYEQAGIHLRTINGLRNEIAVLKSTLVKMAISSYSKPNS